MSSNPILLLTMRLVDNTVLSGTAVFTSMLSIPSFVFFISILLVIGIVIWALFQTFNHNPPNHFFTVFIKLFVYYFAYTIPWWILLVIMDLSLHLFSATTSFFAPVWFELLLLVILSLGLYSVCILKNQLIIQHINHTVPASKNTRQSNDSEQTFAVVSNIHMGLYTHSQQLERLSNTLNQLDVDVVIIIGDWLYNPSADLVGALQSLRGVSKPIYAIQGSSDYRYYPRNADQMLHEDDLKHAFGSLSITEVIDFTPVDLHTTQFSYHTHLFALPTVLSDIKEPSFSQNKHVKSRAFPKIKQSNRALLKDNSLSPSATVIILANTQQDLSNSIRALSEHKSDKISAIALVPKQTLSKINKKDRDAFFAQEVTVYGIDDFGKQGSPFWAKSPSMTILHIKH